MPPVTIIIVFCLKRMMNTLLDEYSDWSKDGLKIQRYGHTEKSSDGYIILEWQKKIPECFMQKLYEDQDIIDFLFYDPNLQAVEVTQEE